MRIKSIIFATAGTLGCIASLLLASGIETTGNFAAMCGWAIASVSVFGISIALIGVANVYADEADEAARKAHKYSPKHTVKGGRKAG